MGDECLCVCISIPTGIVSNGEAICPSIVCVFQVLHQQFGNI